MSSSLSATIFPSPARDGRLGPEFSRARSFDVCAPRGGKQTSRPPASAPTYTHTRLAPAKHVYITNTSINFGRERGPARESENEARDSRVYEAWRAAGVCVYVCVRCTSARLFLCGSVISSLGFNRARRPLLPPAGGFSERAPRASSNRTGNAPDDRPPVDRAITCFFFSLSLSCAGPPPFLSVCFRNSLGLNYSAVV